MNFSSFRLKTFSILYFIRGKFDLLKKALIPVGGLGTRLYPLTVDTSKPMVRFLNNFLIDYILSELAYKGIDEVFLGVSGYYNYRDLFDHLGERFRIKIKNKRKVLRIRYQPNEESIGNAHSIKLMADYFDLNDEMLVVQGDTVSDLDLQNLYKFHESSDAFMTIVLKEIDDMEKLKQYGVAKIDENMNIESFIEKPKSPEEAPSRQVNTGIYLLSEDFIRFIRSSEFNDMIKLGKGDFGKDVIPYLISKKYKVTGFVSKGYWFDVGTLDVYRDAAYYLLNNLPKDRLDVETSYKNVMMQGRSTMSKNLHIELIEKAALKRIAFEGKNLIGRHVKIEDNVVLIDSIIDNYSIIENDNKIVKSIVMDRSYIKKGNLIENSIIGRHTKIGEDVKIVNSYIGNNVIIGDESEIVNSSIWPHRSIESKSQINDKKII
ncbi:MAG: nucleotidyltransferase [Caldisphaera sp.]|nr:MAG: nucleotidyltransferase [Caldisphaera sp.]